MVNRQRVNQSGQSCPKTIIAFCGNNFRNIGDDAFMLVFSDQFIRLRKGEELRITTSYLPVQGDPRKVIPIYHGMSSLRGAHLWRLLKYGRGLVAAVYVGGSMFHEDCYFWREQVKLAILRQINPGLRVAALGASIGPFFTEKQKRRLVSFLNTFDYLSVRDQMSLEFLKNYQVHCKYRQGFDSAALLLDLPGVQLSGDRSKSGDYLVVGMAPCQVQRYRGGDPQQDEARAQKIGEAIHRLSQRRRIKLRLFEFNGHAVQGDGAAIRGIQRAIKEDCDLEIISYVPDPVLFLKEISRCHLLLSMRLHSAVFAFLAQVPLVMLSYHGKCLGLAAEIGLAPQYVFDADDFDPLALADALDNRLETDAPLAISVPQAVESARYQMQYFFDLLEPAGGLS